MEIALSLALQWRVNPASPARFPPRPLPRASALPGREGLPPWSMRPRLWAVLPNLPHQLFRSFSTAANERPVPPVPPVFAGPCLFWAVGISFGNAGPAPAHPGRPLCRVRAGEDAEALPIGCPRLCGCAFPRRKQNAALVSHRETSGAPLLAGSGSASPSSSAPLSRLTPSPPRPAPDACETDKHTNENSPTPLGDERAEAAASLSPQFREMREVRPFTALSLLSRSLRAGWRPIARAGRRPGDSAGCCPRPPLCSPLAALPSPTFPLSGAVRNGAPPAGKRATRGKKRSSETSRLSPRGRGTARARRTGPSTWPCATC